MTTEKDFTDALMDLWPLFILSCGVAWLFRRKLKGGYKGRTWMARLGNDILVSICTGFLAVCISQIIGVFCPELAHIKMQICACGVLSGYGMNVMNRLVMKRLGLSNVDVNDELDITEARRSRRRHE